eukprot:3880140-Rhodomonas_salina.2
MTLISTRVVVAGACGCRVPGVSGQDASRARDGAGVCGRRRRPPPARQPRVQKRCPHLLLFHLFSPLARSLACVLACLLALPHVWLPALLRLLLPLPPSLPFA